jgi:hypothetical protein
VEWEGVCWNCILDFWSILILEQGVLKGNRHARRLACLHMSAQRNSTLCPQAIRRKQLHLHWPFTIQPYHTVITPKPVHVKQVRVEQSINCWEDLIEETEEGQINEMKASD